MPGSILRGKQYGEWKWVVPVSSMDYKAHLVPTLREEGAVFVDKLCADDRVSYVNRLFSMDANTLHYDHKCLRCAQIARQRKSVTIAVVMGVLSMAQAKAKSRGRFGYGKRPGRIVLEEGPRLVAGACSAHRS